MKKLLLFITLLFPLFIGCSSDKDEPEQNNPLVGTTWCWENYLFSSVNGGTWYQTIVFDTNTTYTHYYKSTKGEIKNKTSNSKYEYSSDKVVLYDSEGEVWNTFVFVSPTKMSPVTNSSVVFEKQ